MPVLTRNIQTDALPNPAANRDREPDEDPSAAEAGTTAPEAADPSPAGRRRGRKRGRGIDRKGTGHGMLNAGSVKNRWAVAWRHIKVKLLSKLPGTRFKSRLVKKWLGVTMGEDVGIAYGVLLDPYDPTMISFGDNVIVGTETRIFVHVFTLDRQRVRPVRIGSNVMIGGFCVIAPGVTIGDGASIAPGTFVTRNIPAGAIVTGNTMNIRRRGGRDGAVADAPRD
ncbi:MAG: acyltransferase [Planctomycetota bacterium]|jgi:acetyltransferase-like isoleucine patch superfamily enzyme